jgi:hypothetical protein
VARGVLAARFEPVSACSPLETPALAARDPPTAHAFGGAGKVGSSSDALRPRRWPDESTTVATETDGEAPSPNNNNVVVFVVFLVWVFVLFSFPFFRFLSFHLPRGSPGS